jgi:hypothetical protein
VFAHVGGRYADLAMHDDDLEIAVEVHSAWGTFEWLVDDALARGYRVGICANSDGHKGRPGASYPGARTFGSYGGLTCVLATRLDRRGVHAALRARHFYATTGNRALLDVRVSADGRRPAIMGDALDTPVRDAVLEGHAAGTAPIERVEIKDGPKTIAVLRPFGAGDLGNRVKIAWSGAEVKGRARMTEWDGSLSIAGNAIRRSTPVNFWNPLRPLRRTGPARLEWQSATTGGVAGVILDLACRDRGTLRVGTQQGRANVPVRSVGLEPRRWNFGGLRKQIEIYRLPRRREMRPFGFRVPLGGLRRGTHPLYVKVVQEDGHMAWSSPVFLTVGARGGRGKG